MPAACAELTKRSRHDKAPHAGQKPALLGSPGHASLHTSNYLNHPLPHHDIPLSRELKLSASEPLQLIPRSLTRMSSRKQMKKMTSLTRHPTLLHHDPVPLPLASLASLAWRLSQSSGHNVRRSSSSSSSSSI